MVCFVEWSECENVCNSVTEILSCPSLGVAIFLTARMPNFCHECGLEKVWVPRKRLNE